MKDLHRELIEDIDVPRIRSVVELETFHPRYAVFDCNGNTVAPTVPCLRGLALDGGRLAQDNVRVRPSALVPAAVVTLMFLDRASEAEVSALGWLRVAPNPQRLLPEP